MREPLDELDCRQQLRLPVMPRCTTRWRVILVILLVLAALVWL